jgi:hypothetical protein
MPMFRLISPLSALVLVGATVALAACGGSSAGNSSAKSGTTTSGTAQTGTTQTASRAKFDQCLKDQGVTPPSRPQGGGGNGYGRPGGGNGQPPAGGPGGGGDPKLGQAMQACAKYRPQGGRGGPGGGAGGQQNIQAFTPYLTCLKDAGLDVKVTDGFNALRNLKRDDPKVQAAFKTCQAKLPQRPQGAPNANAAPSTTGTQS